MDYNFVNILENLVESCKGYVEYCFIPETDVISVRVFKYDQMAEYCDDLDSYDYINESCELFGKIELECGDYAKNVDYYVPNDFDKKGYGYFDFREIIINPIE